MAKNRRTSQHRLTATPSRPGRRISDSEVWRLGGDFTQIVWRANADGSHVTAPSWTVVTGQRQDQLQNGGWASQLHPDDRARVQNDWSEALRAQEDFSSEFRVLLRDGRYEWFRAKGEAQRNRRGQAKSWIGILSNIDEQKQAEEALREASARLRLIVESAGVGTLDWNLESDEIDVNARGRELLGLSAEVRVTITDIEDVVYADDRAHLRHAIASAFEPTGSGALDAMFRVGHETGRRMWIGARGRVRFLDEPGNRRGIRLLGVLTDLTQEMRELEDRAWLSTLVDSSNDPIIALSPEGTVTHWNAAAEMMYGYRAEEIVGQPIFRLLAEDRQLEAVALFDSVRNGGEISNMVTERVTKDGRRLTVALTLSPIRDSTGTLIGMSAIERDVTTERFRDEQLREAQKLEAVGQLAGGVAHDLNNILTAMMAGVYLVSQNAALDARSRGRLAQVRDECSRAASVIRELLAFGRKQVVTPHACRPNDIVREAVPMLSRLVGEDIQVETRLVAERGVFVDRAQMLQVLVALAVHARDTMPMGGTLCIETADAASNGVARWVVIRVHDSGAGITAETRARLFEPYFTTRKLGWGTGLGLSVVQGIIAQFGGTIAVDSELGAGTTFTISLPAVDPPALLAGTEAAETEYARGRETVLLVEDERVLRDQVAEALRQLGYIVLEARNGYDALTVLERHGAPVHLVLSDVVMPEMSGGALVLQLRKWYPHLRVLFITGYSEEAVETYGVVVSNTALLLKPFSIDELAARVRGVLDGPRQTDAPALAER